MENHFPTLDKAKYCSLLGKNLSTLRQQVNMSQDELCTRLGFTRVALSNFERGKQVMGWLCFVAIVLFFYLDDDSRNMMVMMGIIDEDIAFALDINKRLKKPTSLKVK